MALRTQLCDLLGIEHPVMLAGMGGVSFAPLVAAVSEAGGFDVFTIAAAWRNVCAAQKGGKALHGLLATTLP